LADLPGPFPAKPPNLGWTPSDSLQDYVKQFATKPPFSQMGIALVDLSRAPQMSYAGWNDTRQIYVASLAKIGAMFAAFQLRQSVRAAAKQVPVADADKVFDAITAAWTPAVSSRTKGRPADFPRLENIFSISGNQGNWTIDFTDAQKDWPEIKKIGDKLPTGLGFRDRMKLMIANSNNHAAASCIDDIGFQYLNGALAAVGLFSAGAGGGGLWIALDYGGHWWGKVAGGGWAQGATASAVAGLLALLETKRLVDAEASKEMRNMMSFKGHYGSWFVGQLTKAGRGPSHAYGKIGLDGTLDDCVVIERSVSIDDRMKTLRYAAVGLGASSQAAIEALIMKLDDSMVEDERMAKFGSKYQLPPHKR
jgi:hypothetical protein